jgi:hypothetical protein
MKDRAYIHLLQFGMINLRNSLDDRELVRTRIEAARCVAQLLHYIPPLLMNDALGPGDAYFLEVGARGFLRDYPLRGEAHFLQTADILLDLYETIKVRMDVAWIFPQEIEAQVRELRGRGSIRG